MRTSRTGIALIKSFESLRLEAYRCPAGVWTIGYGHTAGVRRGDVIDEQRAEYLLSEDLKKFEDVVGRECPHVNQNQFDALVSFTFNCGTGNLLKSTLLKCVKANPLNTNIRGEFMKWNKSKGTVLAGLIRRRKAEADLYFS
ncbi:lysozyme [Parabacteroides sp. AF48-14]|uniref:lysozyme n=1 Tax=Parabacteroides sp. AF48-14 TaxID=2292052 RepID=UPI000EFF68A4|nr:lysozyme [Parabacteroides sp. AF48-14]RHO73421.1 lysozyme [Parabacteroides sp. AF48-14]